LVGSGAGAVPPIAGGGQRSGQQSSALSVHTGRYARVAPISCDCQGSTSGVMSSRATSGAVCVHDQQDHHETVAGGHAGDQSRTVGIAVLAVRASDLPVFGW